MKNRQRLSATEIAGGSGVAAGALDYFIAANREKVAGKTMHSMQLKKKLKKKTATDDRQDGVLVVSPIPVPFPTLIPATISPFPIAASVCCNFSHDYVALTFGLRNQPMQQCNGNCKSYDAPPPCGGPPPSPCRTAKCVAQMESGKKTSCGKTTDGGKTRKTTSTTRYHGLAAVGRQGA